MKHCAFHSRPVIKAADIEKARGSTGLAAGLFLTDRCPVGCKHCSVDSLHDSPTVSDFDLLAELIEALAIHPSLSIIAITGGEPFIERKALTFAVDRLAACEKHVVLFTSGVWAHTPATPEWIQMVLRKTATVFVSTDVYHNDQLPDSCFVNAVKAARDAGCWIVVQVLNVEYMLKKAETLLVNSFGSDFQNYAEIVKSSPLPYGRGADVFQVRLEHRGESFGACRLLGSPIIRYDGWISACCNERVIMGQGASRLRKKCNTREKALEVIDEFENDLLFRIMHDVGVGALTKHDRFKEISGKRFSSICEACWEMQQQVSPDFLMHDRILHALQYINRKS